MTLTFSQLIKQSQEDSDQTARWVHDKLKLRQFASRRGLPVPQLYKSWGTPDEIDWTVAPQEFVLKANVLHGGKGTAPFTRLQNGNFKNLADDSESTPEAIVDSHRALYNSSEYKFSYAVMIEELIRDPNGDLPTGEYEVYCFRNRTSLVVRYGRNTRRGSTDSVAFFDGEFTPLSPSSVVEFPDIQLAVETAPEVANSILTTATGLAAAVDTPFLAVTIVHGSTGPVILGASPFPRNKSYGVEFDLNSNWNRNLGFKWSR